MRPPLSSSHNGALNPSHALTLSDFPSATSWSKRPVFRDHVIIFGLSGWSKVISLPEGQLCRVAQRKHGGAVSSYWLVLGIRAGHHWGHFRNSAHPDRFFCVQYQWYLQTCLCPHDWCPLVVTTVCFYSRDLSSFFFREAVGILKPLGALEPSIATKNRCLVFLSDAEWQGTKKWWPIISLYDH